LRVNNIADLFYMAEVLSKQPSPRGPRLTIVTNAGGPGVLAADALIMGGGELAELTPATLQAYNGVLPSTWSHNNPVDIIGDASPERYAKALQIAANDPNSDGILVILTPQAMTDPTQIAEQLKQAGAGKLDGRRRRGGRRGHPQSRQYPHLPLSRHRGARLQLHVAVQL
jgi:acetyltransferase